MEGLLSLQTPEQVTAREREMAAVPSAVTPNLSMLVGHIQNASNRNKRAREVVDRRLLNCLRRRKGVYSPAELSDFQAQGCASVIFMPISATKCRAAAAWIRDILMPTGDRAWALGPTALPELPDTYKQQIIAKAAQQAQQIMVAGGQAMPPEQFAQMAHELADQMQETVIQETKKEAEARALTDAHPDEPRRWPRLLRDIGLRSAVVTRGKEAAIVFDPTGVAALAPPALETLGDVTGAGDAMASGFLSARLEGKPLAAALRQGAAAALIAVRSPLAVAEELEPDLLDRVTGLVPEAEMLS